MDLTEFAALVADMRAAQREFFRVRGRAELKAARQAEQRVDDALARIHRESTGFTKPIDWPPPALLEFAALVARVRRLQGEYFRTRSMSALSLSQAGEKHVDRALEQLNNPQRNLFEDS